MNLGNKPASCCMSAPRGPSGCPYAMKMMAQNRGSGSGSGSCGSGSCSGSCGCGSGSGRGPHRNRGGCPCTSDPRGCPCLRGQGGCPCLRKFGYCPCLTEHFGEDKPSTTSVITKTTPNYYSEPEVYNSPSSFPFNIRLNRTWKIIIITTIVLIIVFVLLNKRKSSYQS